jgi:hypothetical protein
VVLRSLSLAALVGVVQVALVLPGVDAAAVALFMLLLNFAAGMSFAPLFAAAASGLLSAAVASLSTLLKPSTWQGTAAGVVLSVLPSVQCLFVAVSGQIVALLWLMMASAGALQGSRMRQQEPRSRPVDRFSEEQQGWQSVLSVLCTAGHEPGDLTLRRTEALRSTLSCTAY